MHGEVVGIGSGLGMKPSVTFGYLMVAGVLLACDRLAGVSETSLAPEAGAYPAAAE